MKKVLKNSLVLSLLFGVGLTYGCFFEDSQKEAERLYESGLNALDEKRKDEAISYFQEAVDKDPGHAKAHCRLGQLYRDANHLALAEREFSAALREDPGLVEARRSLAWLLYQREAYEEAIPLFRELLAGRDKDPDIRLALSHSLLGAGDAGEAREMAEKTAAGFPDDVLVQIGLARFYERASLYSLAEDALLKIRDDFPDTPQAHIALMAFYMRRGRLDEAEAVGTGAVRGGLADKGLHQRLFVLENRRENYETALRHLEAAAAMSPDDPDLWMLLGDYHLKAAIKYK
jgi:Flp pilus assembly protein TadD